MIGAAVVFYFSGLAIMAVGRAAGRVVYEVREQFRNHPGIMDYTEKPEYGRVVDICTKDSLRELATPGLLAVLTPIAVGFAFGYAPLGSFLAGAIAAGALMAVFLANSGGAWDNAKKLVEDGHYGGKGSDAHEATIIGDTVGDPFKDTAGPAINPLIKVMNLVSLLIATSVVKYSHNPGAAHRRRHRRGRHRGGRRRRLQAPVDQHCGSRARAGPPRPGVSGGSPAAVETGGAVAGQEGTTSRRRGQAGPRQRVPARGTADRKSARAGQRPGSRWRTIVPWTPPGD